VNSTAHAEGSGAIALGSDAINSIFVTGGINQFFVGQYERLAEAYLNPKALYRELRLDRFTGRTWLLGAIDDFLAANDRGYVVVEAEAGMGKTAFIAWLTRERRYVHHFVRLMPDPNDIALALRSLSAQLIRAWDLQAMAVGGILPSNASRPDFFENMLFEAAAKRDVTRPSEPIVIAIDGLNETAASSVQNPLALPEDLPRGVYIVVTQRTVHVPLAVVTPRRVLRIRAKSPENLADIRSYLDAAVAEPDLDARLAAAGVSVDSLVQHLVVWSGGVWLVLRYVLAELRSGTRRPDDLAWLPVGLWQYYAQFWRQWQRAHEDKWSAVDLPLLVTLTAVQEPVPFELLCELSGCLDTDRAAGLIGDAWRPFLQVQETPEERYTAFHDSLGEFFAGRVNTETLTSAERSFVRRMFAAQQAAHERIANRYLTAWGGLRDGLPGLRGDAVTLDDGYGVRHLVSHLVHASADAVLHGLMELEWSRDDVVDLVDSSPAANAWYEVHRARRAFAGYALDVERAWAYAEQSPTRPTASDGQRSIALELRYALVAASVNSVAGNVPADLLLLLIDHGLVTTEQGFDLARENTDPRTRAEALTTLAPWLTGEMRQEAVREALVSAQLVPDGYWRAGEVLRLVPVAGSDYVEDIARVGNSMSSAYYRDIVLRALAVHSQPRSAAPTSSEATSSSLNPADPEVLATRYRERIRHGVATLMIGAGSDLSSEMDARQHVAASRFVRSPRWRAELLTALARTAPQEARGDILRAALGISFTVGDRHLLSSTLGSIAGCLAELGDVPKALACVSDVHDPEGLAQALFVVAAHTPPSQRVEVAQRALDVTEGIEDAVVRSEMLCRHAVQLAGLVGQDRLERVLASISDDWRASVLGALAEGVDAGQRQELLTAALAIIAASHEVGRARVITVLIPQLTPALLASACDVVSTIEDPEQHDRATAALAGRLGRLGDAGPANEAMRTIADPHWLIEAQFNVACGLAASGQRDQAAVVAARLASPPWRAEALARSGRFKLAFDLADSAPDLSTRIAVLLRIGSVTQTDGVRDGVEEARAALIDVVDIPMLSPLVIAVCLALAGYGRPEAGIELVRGLPDNDRAAALLALARHVGDAVVDAVALARELRDPVRQAQVLAGLTAPLVAAHALDLQYHVRDVLHLLAAGTRVQLLEATPDLLPGLVELAGPQGLIDMAAAITAAYRWWP
jgi:hypothetical protein